MSSSPLHFERLEVVQLAIANASWIRTTRWPARTGPLHEQAMRAADSVVLNLAEGASHTKGHRGKHFAIARASCAEVLAVTLLVDLPEGAAGQERLRRVHRMIAGLR